MPLIDRLLSIGRIRRSVWKFWYSFLTRRLYGEDVLFLNYAFEEEPPMNIPLQPADERHRACIQLYHHVATQVPLQDKNVLVVSCGHGGGASYLARTLAPHEYTALDLNVDAIRFCRERHRVDGLIFVQGDAENLPFEPDTFDAVINVEASHCYPSFTRFVEQVARVLRPGGYFLYADFRPGDRVARWEKDLSRAPFQILRTRNINAEVLRGMEANSARSLQLIERYLPGFLRPVGRNFAGTRGSAMYNALSSGELSYRSYCLEKSLH